MIISLLKEENNVISLHFNILANQFVFVMNRKTSNNQNCENPWFKKGLNNADLSDKHTSENKFQNAQKKLQAAVQKHLEEQEFESSSDEEILESNSILNDVFKNYVAFNKEENSAEKTRQFLENAFQSGAGVCLICIASIKRADAVWNCTECYGCFHLHCIQQWSRDSIQQQKLAQSDLPAFKKIDKIFWACPKCRKNYLQDEIPQKYYCFCGKVEDPQHHPWHVPHSCGETCNKLLTPKCGHSCLLLCHPGPCPPCPKTIQSFCYCQKQGPKQVRCSSKLWSCNFKCKKPLLCKKHFCEELCHAGDCQPCKKESLQKCNCGLEERKQPCFNPNWQCQNVCQKAFSCGFHKCLLVCHKGSCGECPLSLERSCPCGKTSAILPCTTEIPTCNDTCGKVLECGIHQCSQKCHKDKCGKCLEIVTKVCRCGLHKKELPCQKEFVCETKCKRQKNCLKHYCNKKCCDLNCPPCEKPCGKTLKCGYHKCPSVCHRGQCYPCPQVAQVKCRCSKTVITVPCGRQKKTSPPKCNKPCLIPPTCHHPTREPHLCHFGDCRPCQQICGKKRSSCPHDCPAPCHSSVWVRIEDDHQPSGPWEIVEPKLKRYDLPCPDCQVSVPVTCFGGHETLYLPCFKAQSTSCQRPCGRKLKCENHSCDKICHVVPESGDNIHAGENCSECNSKCLKERPPGCTHQCPNPCHPGPCPPCSFNVKVKCYCGISTLYFHCKELNTTDNDAKMKLSCGNNCPKKYPCGHDCKENCHAGDCPDPDSCKRKVKISCKCGRIKKTTCDVVRGNNKTIFECDKFCNVKNQDEIKDKNSEIAANEENLKKIEKEKIPFAKKLTSLTKHNFLLLGIFVGMTAILIYFLS